MGVENESGWELRSGFLFLDIGVWESLLIEVLHGRRNV